MAKNTKQIALIQHRRGQLSELPTQLNEGEFGLALDTNQLFIGNPTNKKLSQRINENIFPYGNIEVLTEFTDNLQKIKYTYKSNTDTNARLPIIIYGQVSNPLLPANSSIIINGTEVYFKNNSTLQNIVNTINSYNDLPVKAFIYNDSYFGLISTDLEIYVEDGIISTESNLNLLGITADGFYSKTAESLSERTLQETLDDYCSIKAFGVKGDGNYDDSLNIFNAIISTYKIGKHPQYYRTLFFPAGEYIISTKSIPLPFGTHLKGEGYGRTIIKSKNFVDGLLLSMDDNFNLINSLSFSNNSSSIDYITIEDMTFDVSSNEDVSSLLSIGSSKHILFKNVEFIGKKTTILANITNGINLPNSFNIIFENCIFDTGINAIVSSSNIEHLVIKNCTFKNIQNEAILFNNSESSIINTIIDGNDFTNCGALSNTIISLSENCHYTSTINNKFDNNVTDGSSSIKSYKSSSELNYTDILEPSTNTKKLLRFKFTQPIWDFIDYLTNPNGENIVESQYETQIINGDEKIPQLTNKLLLNQGDSYNNNTFTLKSSLQYGHLNINSGNYGNVNLGLNDENSYYPTYNSAAPYKINDIVQIINNNVYSLYKCLADNQGKSLSDTAVWQKISDYNPSIVFNKLIDVNNNSITNNGANNNINFVVNKEGILTIEDKSPNGIDDYDNKISSVLNAIPTVKYVNKVATSSIMHNFNFNENLTLSANKLELVYFDPTIYGDVVNLDRISINVRNPFYSIQEKIKNALAWKGEIRYYKGDVVSINNGQEYWIATDDHYSTGTEFNIKHWEPVYTNHLCQDGVTRALKDVKYLSIIANNEIENPARLLFRKNEVNIADRDIKGTYYPYWATKTAYKVGDKVSYDNRYWQCLKNHTSANAYDLHNISLWTAVSEEGYNYVYEYDRDITPIDFKSETELTSIQTSNDEGQDYINDEIRTFNYSGYHLYVRFYDENQDLLPIVVHNYVSDDEQVDDRYMQMNPSGYISFKIRYIRGENNEA
nr:MAG TPA: Pectate lyase [Caudoviricetes sp.]